MELNPRAYACLLTAFAGPSTGIGSVLAFFGGMFLIALIDKLIPAPENRHGVVAGEHPPVPDIKGLCRPGYGRNAHQAQAEQTGNQELSQAIAAVALMLPRQSACSKSGLPSAVSLAAAATGSARSRGRGAT